ncbi:MAG: DUF1838 family protein [Myxococcales bacterium]|nr:DUF1838 family protein [Myxococcales bacterium]
MNRWLPLASCLWIIGAAGCHGGGAPRPAVAARAALAEIDTHAFLRLRCALDGRDVVYTWTGAAYAFMPDVAPRHVFDLVGMNVARCLRWGDRWFLTSRELMLYLEPGTRRVLDRWTNPWTGDEVPVVHVANRLVQNELGGSLPALVSGSLATISVDVPLGYPNPLAATPELAKLDPHPVYRAGEFFTFVTPLDPLLDAERATVSDVALAWHRIGPFLPWMAMGDRTGDLVYSAQGRKLAPGEHLAPELAQAIDRVPVFRSAPACVVEGRNETSWTYFARHAAAYQRGARFPVDDTAADPPCRAR